MIQHAHINILVPVGTKGTIKAVSTFDLQHDPNNATNPPIIGNLNSWMERQPGTVVRNPYDHVIGEYYHQLGHKGVNADNAEFMNAWIQNIISRKPKLFIFALL